MDSLRVAIRCICVSWSPLSDMATLWLTLATGLGSCHAQCFIAAIMGSEKNTGSTVCV